jgi:hypothetical protein
MKFDKAYCEELESAVTPYFAKELFFDKESEFFNHKLTFKCEDEDCRVSLVAVNIYTNSRTKQIMHFRTKPNSLHKDNCSYEYPKESGQGQKKDAKSSYRYKKTPYPSEFLLERLKRKERNINVVTVEDIDSNNEAPYTKTRNSIKENKKRESIVRTSSLDYMVDCYINGNETELERHLLTIAEKTKYFKNFFKKIKFFQDEEGLIYWGKIKELKEYGKNYRVEFESKVIAKETNLSTRVSIYIRQEHIEKYRKSKLFSNQLNDLTKCKKEVLCFFVGAYPRLTSIEGKSGSFSVFDVNIDNLDHIVFTFG